MKQVLIIFLVLWIPAVSAAEKVDFKLMEKAGFGLFWGALAGLATWLAHRDDRAASGGAPFEKTWERQGLCQVEVLTLRGLDGVAVRQVRLRWGRVEPPSP